MTTAVLRGRYFRKYPSAKPLGHAEKDLALSVADTSFVLVDVHGIGFDGRPEPQAAQELATRPNNRVRKRAVVVERIRPALDAARAAGYPIIYVNNSAPRICISRSTFGELKWNTLQSKRETHFAEPDIDPREYHRGASNALQFSEIVAPRRGDFFIRKHVHSGFFDTRLDTLLRNLNCRNLVFVGFALDNCLGTTMVGALWRNYRVLLLRDCTLATEIAGIDEPGAWTARWVLHVECDIGYTCTSADWIRACSQVY